MLVVNLTEQQEMVFDMMKRFARSRLLLRQQQSMESAGSEPDVMLQER